MNSLQETSDAQLRRAIAALDSLIDGEAAVVTLIANGNRSVPYLEEYLLRGRPRTVSPPRCRAVHALGQLGAPATLISYFREYRIPDDAQVRFAEDAVRSAAADELLHWKSSEIFGVLMDAARQRATSGLIFALGEFRRSECVPFLFEMLGDDFCRNEAIAALQKVPEDAHQFAILTLRDFTGVRVDGPSGLSRLRAILQLLQEVGFCPDEWEDLRRYLASDDADIVIGAAALGLENGPNEERQDNLNALYRVSYRINWMQEAQIEALLDSCHDEAYELARMNADRRMAVGEQPRWLDPSWRILKHVLRKELAEGHDARAQAGMSGARESSR